MWRQFGVLRIDNVVLIQSNSKICTLFLQPANEVCEGYVFTGVCLSTGGVHAMHAPPSMHAPEHACTPGHARAPSGGYYEMWSMNGRYASYWNAFLLYQ